MAKKNYQELASRILENVGTASNIASFTHCVTRLRFTCKDKSAVKTADLEKIPGVIGTTWSGEQLQVIIGQEVGRVYDVICEVSGLAKEEAIDENLDGTKFEWSVKNVFNVVLDTLSSCIAPLIPPIVACGLTQGLLYSLMYVGWLDGNSETYAFFWNLATAAFYFLPVLAGFTAAKRFKCNQMLGATLGAVLIAPGFIALSGTSIKLFGFLPITFGTYSSTIVPVILGVWFMSYVEKLCKKLVPHMIDIIVTPLVSLSLGAIVSFLFLAPLGSWIGSYVANGVVWLYSHLGPVGGAAVAAVYPLMLATGMQVAMSPFTVQNLATFGYDLIYPCTAASNAAMSACALFIYFAAKNKDTKSLGLSTGVTGMIGVTEPVFFGVIAKYKKAFIAAVIGGACGGAIMGMFQVKYLSFGFVPFGTIVLAMTDTFVWYLVGVFVAIIAAVIAMKLLNIKKDLDNE